MSEMSHNNDNNTIMLLTLLNKEDFDKLKCCRKCDWYYDNYLSGHCVECNQEIIFGTCRCNVIDTLNNSIQYMLSMEETCKKTVIFILEYCRKRCPQIYFDYFIENTFFKFYIHDRRWLIKILCSEYKLDIKSLIERYQD